MVVHDFPPRIIGGEGVVAEKIACTLTKLGIDLTVICPDQPDSQSYDQRMSFKTQRIRTFGRNFVLRTASFWAGSRHRIRSFDGDLIYYWRPAALRKDIASVFHVHTWRSGLARACAENDLKAHSAVNRIYATFDTIMVKNCARVIAPRKELAREIARIVPEKPGKVVTIGNPIQINQWPDRAAEIRSVKKLLFIGRLDKAKGVLDLIHAMGRLRKSHPLLSLCIIGDGPEKARAVRLVEDLKMENSITFSPSTDSNGVLQALTAHDLLVVPTHFETFGMILLEAALVGIPIISTRDCLQLGQHTFPRGDIPSLVLTLTRYISNPGLLAESAGCCRLTAEKFDDSQVSKELLSEIEKTQKVYSQKKLTAEQT